MEIQARGATLKAFLNFYDSLIAPTRERLVPLIRGFLLRNTGFMAAFDGVMQEKLPEQRREQIRKLGEEWKVGFTLSRLHRWQQGELLPFTIRPGVASVRLVDPLDKAAWNKLQDDFGKRASATTSESLAAAFARDFHLPTDCTPEWIAAGLLGSKDGSGHFVNAGHTLLLSVDLRRPWGEVGETVKEVFQQHQRAGDNRDCFGKWPQYLLVHDLYAVLKSYEKCADFFEQAFPSDNSVRHLQERENVRRHRRKAKELIAGGFRAYLI